MLRVLETKAAAADAAIAVTSAAKQHGFIRLPYSVHRSAYGWIPIPVASIKNGKGPRILLMAGNHGDEYEGQVAPASSSAWDPTQLPPVGPGEASLVRRPLSTLDDLVFGKDRLSPLECVDDRLFRRYAVVHYVKLGDAEDVLSVDLRDRRVVGLVDRQRRNRSAPAECARCGAGLR